MMLRSLSEPEGYRLSAQDGEIGRCGDFLFDDTQWTVRYMVAKTGGWLSHRKLLIAPTVLESPDWDSRRFPVRLTRRQIEDSPPLDSDAPVSRRYEQTFHDFFMTPYYWVGTGTWGNYPYPELMTPPEIRSDESSGVAPAAQPGRSTQAPPQPAPQPPTERDDGSHLQSLREVTGYHVRAVDGEAGKLEDMIVDDRSWQLRFLVVDTSWLPFSKKVLIPLEWVEDISWVDRRITVGVAKQRIEDAPSYNPHEPIDEERETMLYDHYGRPRDGTGDHGG
jgi:hypothetical protein